MYYKKKFEQHFNNNKKSSKLVDELAGKYLKNSTIATLREIVAILRLMLKKLIL